MSGPRGNHTMRHVTVWLAAMAVIAAMGPAEYVVVHGLVLALAVLAAIVAAYGLGRRHGRAGARKAATLRLEDAQRASLVAELEQLAARPLDVIIQDYRRMQSRYGGGQR